MWLLLQAVWRMISVLVRQLRENSVLTVCAESLDFKTLDDSGGYLLCWSTQDTWCRRVDKLTPVFLNTTGLRAETIGFKIGSRPIWAWSMHFFFILWSVGGGGGEDRTCVTEGQEPWSLVCQEYCWKLKIKSMSFYRYDRQQLQGNSYMATASTSRHHQLQSRDKKPLWLLFTERQERVKQAWNS